MLPLANLSRPASNKRRTIPFSPLVNEGWGIRKLFSEILEGCAGSGCQAVLLESLAGVLEKENGWILRLAFTPAAYGPNFDEGFLKIL